MGGGVWAGGEAALRAAGRGGGRRRPGQVPGGGVAPKRLEEDGDVPAMGGWWADGAAARAAGRGGGRRGGGEDAGRRRGRRTKRLLRVDRFHSRAR